MSFAANTKEPRQSEIPQKSDPVYGDKNGRNIFKFNTPNQNFRKFALEENGYYLEGNVNEIFKKDSE